MLLAGEAILDITPPLGIELAGFHRPAGKERKITGIRQSTAARALVLKEADVAVAIVVLEVLGIPASMVKRIQQRAAAETGIAAENVHVSATHTHSAPTLIFLRQWGAVSEPYNKLVEDRAVAAVIAAQKDLAETDFYLGKQRVEGGNHNRTTKKWKTDADFGKGSSDADRWVDTALHALFFLREKPKPCILWYQFSAHAVCYTDTLAGPDWPGLVAAKTEARDGYRPAFLQGHCGDVNPGDGSTSLGDPEKVSEAVWAALHHATSHSEAVMVDAIECARTPFKMPLDLERLEAELAQYRKDPAACSSGEWVDPAFAKDWFASASQWPKEQNYYSATLSAIRLGSVALLLHPAELYSAYGLTIRRDSPFPDTVVCGYAGDLIGYVTDPAAYENKEYAALVVPKILGLPPFTANGGRELTAAALKLLHTLKTPTAREL